MEVTNPSIGIQDDAIIDGCAIICMLQLMAQQRIHGGCSVELRQVCHRQDEQLQRTRVIMDRYNRTQASRILTRY